MNAVRLVDLDMTMSPGSYHIGLCRVPAGFPSPAEGEEEDPIDLSQWLIENPAATYLMRIDGWSMSGGGINDGDIVVVSRAERPRPGHIVVAVVHGERTLKRLKKMDERLWLVPEAEGYAHTLVDEYVEVWGVVVGLARRYR